jgi:hypothetical protein
LVLFLVAVVACSINPVPTSIHGEPIEIVTEYVKIDDEVISQGDLYTITDPIWWTANIYDGEQKYNESLARFSQEQRYIFAVISYIDEVITGDTSSSIPAPLVLYGEMLLLVSGSSESTKARELFRSRLLEWEVIRVSIEPQDSSSLIPVNPTLMT